MSVVITAFKETDVKNALKGFGVLVPRKEQKNGFFTLGMFLTVPSNSCVFCCTK